MDLHKHGIDDDGTMDGYVIETHYKPAKNCVIYEDCDWVEISFDDGVLDGATRIPFKAFLEIADKIRAKVVPS